MNRVKEFIESAYSLENAWIIAALTDQYIVDQKSETCLRTLEENAEKVLEIRIFNNECEYKLFRTDIGKPFTCRVIKEEDIEKEIIEGNNFFDENHYLDIDNTKPLDTEGRVTTTGGGKYKLPIDIKSRPTIRVRYYLGKYPESGQARIEDWRIIEFIGE